MWNFRNFVIFPDFSNLGELNCVVKSSLSEPVTVYFTPATFNRHFYTNSSENVCYCVNSWSSRRLVCCKTVSISKKSILSHCNAVSFLWCCTYVPTCKMTSDMFILDMNTNSKHTNKGFMGRKSFVRLMMNEMSFLSFINKFSSQCGYVTEHVYM